jgi:hypothetical protein
MTGYELKNSRNNPGKRVPEILILWVESLRTLRNSTGQYRAVQCIPVRDKVAYVSVQYNTMQYTTLQYSTVKLITI